MKKIIYSVLLVLICTNFIFSEENFDKISQNDDKKAQTVQSSRLNFINEAYKYLNTPYKYAGVDKNGIDCSGLIYRCALDSLDKAMPRSSTGIADFVKRIENADIQPGDLLFFNTFGNKVSHVAIYIGDGEFIHSASAGSKTGVILSSLTENYWKNCYLFAGRILPKEDIF